MSEEQSGIDPELANQLFRHTSKPEWGYAILAWSNDDKQGYQFEDGKLRVFHRDYLKLLEHVDLPADETGTALGQLRQQLGWQKAASASSSSASDIIAVSLEAQVEYIKKEFPDGFSGSVWQKKRRGKGTSSRLKRHRDHSIAEAKTMLEESALRGQLASGDVSSVIDSLQRIAAGTDMVSKSQAAPLSDLAPGRHASVVESLVDLLYGDKPYSIRFEQFIVTLGRGIGKKPTWPLVTLYPALVHPESQVHVEQKVVAQQAAWMAPGLTIDRQPMAPTYERIVDMYGRLAAELESAWSKPNDHIDIYDFMKLTLRPKVLKEIRGSTEKPLD